jgi:hypothetical protein
MKTLSLLLLLTLVLCLLPFIAQSQSTMEFQPGTTIEVQSGADICADAVLKNGTTIGSGTQCTLPLPVELVNLAVFTGQSTRNGVTINWTTATETNNFGYEIERRLLANGTTQSSDWASIGFVQGKGTSASPTKYNFTDENLTPGRYSYRIKQIDKNGSFVYTDATDVEVGLAPKVFTLNQNYPNPFNPTTTIEFTLEEDAHVVLNLYDVTGREIATLVNDDRKAGYYQSVTVDASHLGTGMYVYRLEANGKVLSRKMLLVK